MSSFPRIRAQSPQRIRLGRPAERKAGEEMELQGGRLEKPSQLELIAQNAEGRELYRERTPVIYI